MSGDELRLMLAFGGSVVVLVVLITRYAVSPFVALLMASVLLAVGAGLELAEAWRHFAGGVGAVLSPTAMVIGLGAMIGVLLHHSGGAAEIADRLVRVLGAEHLGWTMLAVGLLVGVGVWFTVGLVLLVPIAVSLARVAKVGLLIPAMSMLAGLSAMHGLAPPHPGPLVAISLLEADLGRTILWSLLVASVAAAVAGPLFWRMFPHAIAFPTFEEPSPAESPTRRPTGFWAPLAVIAVPIVLMLVGSFAMGPEDTTPPAWATLLVGLGEPTMAMLIGLLLAIVLLGRRSGFSRPEIARMTQESLAPVGNVLLVVAAGSGFSRVLIASGVGEALAGLTEQVPLPSLVLAWLIAAAFRVATGSATTAITAAGGIVAALLVDDSAINREFVVLALGAGSLILSHVNDGGFWFVKELFGLTVEQTLKTWTVLETVLSIVALVVILGLDAVFG